MAGNPTWKPGGKSPNPDGRRRQTQDSKRIKSSLRRFFKEITTIKELRKLRNDLGPSGKLQIIEIIFPYLFPKLSAIGIKSEINGLDKEAIDELYARLTGTTDDISFDEILQIPETIKDPT